jgi:hypothetical protein
MKIGTSISSKMSMISVTMPKHNIGIVVVAAFVLEEDYSDTFGTKIDCLWFYQNIFVLLMLLSLKEIEIDNENVGLD